MLGLTVNTFIDTFDKEVYETHRVKASTMDINDIFEPKLDYLSIADEPMPELETDDDEPGPSQRVLEPSTDPEHLAQDLPHEEVSALNVTPIRVLPPPLLGAEPVGTPVGCTGSSAGATQDVLPARTSRDAEPLGTPGGCSTSSSPRANLVIPKTEPRDDIDRRSRPTLELFRDTRKKMKKTPYSELPVNEVIDVSDDEDGDMDIMGQFGLDADANKKVKEESLSVSELNAIFEQKMKEKLAEAAAVNAKKMEAIEEELRVSNAKTDTILAMLERMASSSQPPAPAYPYPPGAYPPGANPPGLYPLPTYPRAPYPTPLGTPPSTPIPPPLDHVASALKDDEFLRTAVREVASSEARPEEQDPATYTDVGERNDSARRTVSAEDTQMSPIEKMEVDERSPIRKEMGGIIDEDEHIPDSQASPAQGPEDLMDTEVVAEAFAEATITNDRSSMSEEGEAAPPANEAPPRDLEVTHL